MVIKSRRIRGVEHVAHMLGMRNGYKVSGRKAEGKRPLRRPRHRWEGNIKMNCKEIGCEWYGLDSSGSG
jgi:hypothetical protein